MPEPRYPTLDEFWKRLSVRDVEPDLRSTLESRLQREQLPIQRVGQEATVIAVIARLLPGAVPAKALAVFLDNAFDQQLGQANERIGVMPRGELIPTGFVVLDTAARETHGMDFAKLSPEQQDALLEKAERGELGGSERFNAAIWFSRVRDLALLGFGSDPRGMVQMGFPGPSYKPGHIWLDDKEVAARTKRKPGYLKL
jgi:hypothetical protein